MEIFQKSKWIWPSTQAHADEYGEFYFPFYICKKQTYRYNISCDGDYVLFINGEFVSSNQYGDFEHYKIYDAIDCTPFLNEGLNHIAILVWYPGVGSSRYKKAAAGLIFEIRDGAGRIVAWSDEKTRARKSKAYKNGYQKLITGQLGFSFLYDSTKEDEWIYGKLVDFTEAAIVSKNCRFYERPNEKLLHGEFKPGKLVSSSKNSLTFDCGEETVGLLKLKITSPCIQKITISYGEYLVGGRVPRLSYVDENRIGRDFSVEYIARKGLNEYVNYMLRLGCRYLEICFEHCIEVEALGIIPTYYPVERAEIKLDNPLDREIYEIAVRTLELCMMEHYVDSPWREQCLYSFDSRNQMLFGYYAFKNGNRDYARSNLLLMSKDDQEGLLPITFPCGIDLKIPSYSLYYIIAMKEYIEHTNDFSLGIEFYPKMAEILNAFLKNRHQGLVCKFRGYRHWNFYDWSAHSVGEIYGPDSDIPKEEADPDCMINSLMIIALNCFEYICQKIGQDFIYDKIRDEIKSKTKEVFFVSEDGAFAINKRSKEYENKRSKEYTELCNSFAILAGLPEKKEAERIATAIVEKKLEPCSLAMRALKYDALLKVNQEKYRNVILNEIRQDYGYMLSEGATSFWETLGGHRAFGNAGSLCHGWSALPAYYYHLLL